MEHEIMNYTFKITYTQCGVRKAYKTKATCEGLALHNLWLSVSHLGQICAAKVELESED